MATRIVVDKLREPVHYGGTPEVWSYIIQILHYTYNFTFYVKIKSFIINNIISIMHYIDYTMYCVLRCAGFHADNTPFKVR